MLGSNNTTYVKKKLNLKKSLTYSTLLLTGRVEIRAQPFWGDFMKNEEPLEMYSYQEKKMDTPKNRLTFYGNRYKGWRAILSTSILSKVRLFLGVSIFFSR